MGGGDPRAVGRRRCGQAVAVHLVDHVQVEVDQRQGHQVATAGQQAAVELAVLGRELLAPRRPPAHPRDQVVERRQVVRAEVPGQLGGHVRLGRPAHPQQVEQGAGVEGEAGGEGARGGGHLEGAHVPARTRLALRPARALRASAAPPAPSAGCRRASPPAQPRSAGDRPAGDCAPRSGAADGPAPAPSPPAGRAPAGSKSPSGGSRVGRAMGSLLRRRRPNSACVTTYTWHRSLRASVASSATWFALWYTAYCARQSGA